MKRIAYVGLKKDGETAFAAQCGIAAFLPGTVVEVNDPGLAAKMLFHNDVFEEAPPQSLPRAEGLGPDATGEQLRASYGETGTGQDSGTAASGTPPVITDPTAGMDVDALRALVKARNLPIKGASQMGEDKLRAKVIEALAAAPKE